MEDTSRVVLDGQPRLSPHDALSPTVLFLSNFNIVPPLCLVKSISHSYPFASYVAAETKPMGRVAVRHPHPCRSTGFESLM